MSVKKKKDEKVGEAAKSHCLNMFRDRRARQRGNWSEGEEKKKQGVSNADASCHSDWGQ